MGTYTKKKLLGSGAYGEVYLASHDALKVDYAVKYIPVAKVITPTNIFYEPQLLKKLEHPNIIAVHDAGYISKDEIFIAMEYVPGGSLEGYLGKRPIKLRRIKHIFCEALRGLQYAHEKGYIHRDIKCANILLDRKQKGKISDFGLAIRPPAGVLGSPAGTPFYIAPETLTNGETSQLSDIYAMGVSLYEAVNGEDYFPTVTDVAELYQQIQAGTFPDRAYYRIYIPRKLRSVINKALHLDKARRYQSAEQLREALEQTPIRCSWTEKNLLGEQIWTAVLSDRKVVVRLVHNGAAFDVEVRQRAKGTSMYRHVRQLELKKVPRTDALKRVGRITTSLVSTASIVAAKT